MPIGKVKVIKPAKIVGKLNQEAMRFKCPTCNAKPNTRCQTVFGRTIYGSVHEERFDLARKARRDANRGFRDVLGTKKRRKDIYKDILTPGLRNIQNESDKSYGESFEATSIALVKCPTCDALPGERCREYKKHRRILYLSIPHTHKSRLDEAMKRFPIEHTKSVLKKEGYNPDMVLDEPNKSIKEVVQPEPPDVMQELLKDVRSLVGNASAGVVGTDVLNSHIEYLALRGRLSRNQVFDFLHDVTDGRISLIEAQKQFARIVVRLENNIIGAPRQSDDCMPASVAARAPENPTPKDIANRVLSKEIVRLDKEAMEGDPRRPRKSKKRQYLG